MFVHVWVCLYVFVCVCVCVSLNKFFFGVNVGVCENLSVLVCFCVCMYSGVCVLSETVFGSFPKIVEKCRKYFRHFSEAAQTCTLFTIPFANLRGNVMRTFLGKSDFYWPLMVLAEQWQYMPMSSLSRVLFIRCSFNFLQTEGLQTDRSRYFRHFLTIF